MMMRLGLARVILAVAMVVASAGVVEAQHLTPLSYQTVNPPTTEGEGLKIYTSSLLERLLKVDDKAYEFNAIMFLYFSWKDTGAREKMEKSTLAYRNGTGECYMPCIADSTPSASASSFSPEFSCCDDIWLPQVVAYNLLPPFHTQFDGIVVGTDGTVGWYKSLYARYFTGMEFRNFPLDSQRLQISLGLNTVSEASQEISFIPSASSTAFMMRQGIEGHKGALDSVSGWEIKEVSMEAVDVPLMEAVEYFIYDFGNGPANMDPLPMAGNKSNSASPFTNPELKHYGINVYIDVKRMSDYYIINQIVPIYVLVLVSILTYFHNPSKLDVRIGVNVTCFLALTGIKWVVNRELPNSSYPTTVSMIIVTSYALFGFAVVESLVVYTVYKAKKQEEEEEGKEEIPEVDSKVASHPSSPRSPTLIKQGGLQTILSNSKKWSSFSKGIRKIKGDHDFEVTETAIIIDMCSLTLVALTSVISSAIYFNY